MEILKNFGFEPVMLVAQIVNFLIILFLLKRFLYKPILSMLKKREDEIAAGIKNAEEARITLEKSLEEEKKILSKAQDESRKMLDEAKSQALEVSREIEENTKRQTEKMIDEAKLKIEQESKDVEKRLSEKVSILAAEMVAKSLEGTLSEKEQKQIINKSLKGIKKVS